MDRESLKRYLDEGLSLDAIGARVGKHPSTVAYWLAKQHLEANGKRKHSPRGDTDVVRPKELVDRGQTLKQIAAELGVSMSTVRYWIARLDLRPPIQVRRAEVQAALAAGDRTLTRECRKHGWTTFVIENSGRTRCRKCRIERVSEWRRRTKRRLVEEAGGQCLICGYDQSYAALEFHHRDPSQKLFQISNQGVPRSIEVLREEAAKCALLCGNCHAEVEAGVTDLPD